MDQNMDNPNPTPENQPPQSPEQPPQQSTPTEYDASAPPIPEQPSPQTPPPATGEISKDAKMWGMFCHLAALAMFTSIPFANVLGPLILWLIKKDEFAFVDDQGKEALNFQISIAIYAIVCIPLFFVIVGIFLFAALGIFNLVMIIIASIESNKGNAYRYPLCIRIVK
ncbi:MAG: DUF4870 domain-containing protein [Planctomycetota bacterium]